MCTAKQHNLQLRHLLLLLAYITFESIKSSRTLLLTFAKEVMFSSLFVCLSVCLTVSNFAQNLRTDLHEIFRKGWQCV